MPMEPHLTRENPMVWVGEEEAQGVFVGVKPDQVDLLGLDGRHVEKEFRLPSDFTAGPEILAVFDRIRDNLTIAAAHGAVEPIDLMAMTPDQRRDIGGMLGEGEVNIVAGLDPVFQMEESLLPGVWRVRATDAAGELISDIIEIAEIPTALRAAAHALTRPMPPIAEGAAGPGVMNGPAVLAEIQARAEAWRPGVKNHVINFTLFPLTEEDGALIGSALGEIPLSIISTGFGDCRITGTKARHVWAVQFLNAMGTVILDTIEVGDVPAFACAALEDFEDSAARISDILQAYLQ